VGDRREFLLKIAKGVAYSAPVISTLAGPSALLAQEDQTTTKGGMGTGMGMLVVQPPPPPPTTSTAPWAKKPGG
jgi:hypothetical protein